MFVAVIFYNDMRCRVCCGGFNHDMKCQVLFRWLWSRHEVSCLLWCFYHDMKCQVWFRWLWSGHEVSCLLRCFLSWHEVSGLLWCFLSWHEMSGFISMTLVWTQNVRFVAVFFTMTRNVRLSKRWVINMTSDVMLKNTNLQHNIIRHVIKNNTSQYDMKCHVLFFGLYDMTWYVIS